MNLFQGRVLVAAVLCLWAAGAPRAHAVGYCGDGVCAIGENALTCPADCPSVCGDNVCAPPESYTNCLRDCPAPAGAVIETLKFATYNAKLVENKDWPGDNYLSVCTSLLGYGKDCDELRGQNLGSRLRGQIYESHLFNWADVVNLQETFDDSARNEIREEISNSTYPGSYWGQPNGGLLQTDGGLSSVSRLPWYYDGSMEQQFDVCDGVCGQAKGFKAVRLTLPVSGRHLYVINTHLEHASENHAVRLSQLRQIRDWVDDAIPHEPVVLMGDLNVKGDSEEYEDVCGPDAWGRCSAPDGPLRGFVDVYRSVWGEPEQGFLQTGYTVNGYENDQVGDSGKRKRIDYIFYRDGVFVGVRPRSRFDVFVDRQPIGNERIDHDDVRCEYLSDHFALLAALDFCNGPCAQQQVANAVPGVGDGRCNGAESECHFALTTSECGRNTYALNPERDSHCATEAAPTWLEFRNGGFESGLTPWTLSGNAQRVADGIAGQDARSGSGYVALRSPASGAGGGGDGEPLSPPGGIADGAEATPLSTPDVRRAKPGAMPAPDLPPMPPAPPSIAAQRLHLPAASPILSLRFYAAASTTEAPGLARDFLTVELRTSSGSVLQTLAGMNNTQNGGYLAFGPFDLGAWRGQDVELRFVVTGNSTAQSTFRIDDVSLVGALPARVAAQ